MTATLTAPPAPTIHNGPPARPGLLRAFGTLMHRDLLVTGRELGSFLAQVLIQPFFILFIFGKVLGDLGYASGDFASVLLPGIIALNGFLGALQNATLPLVMEFSYTREIEDRLLAPVPLAVVALEKIVFGALRGVAAALVMVPVGLLVLPGVTWPVSALLPSLGIVVLGSLAGAAIGMTIGTLVEPRHINILFAVILTPLMFTGATQFPWPGLEAVPWFQWLCAANPLTYVSEAMRGVLTPAVPHIPLGVDVLVLTAAIVLFTALGVRGFRRRALD